MMTMVFYSYAHDTIPIHLTMSSTSHYAQIETWLFGMMIKFSYEFYGMSNIPSMLPSLITRCISGLLANQVI